MFRTDCSIMKKILAFLLILTMLLGTGIVYAAQGEGDPLKPADLEYEKDASGKANIILHKQGDRIGPDEWKVTVKATVGENPVEKRKIEVVFVLDTSGSMAWCTDEAAHDAGNHSHSNSCRKNCGYANHTHQYSNYGSDCYGNRCTQAINPSHFVNGNHISGTTCHNTSGSYFYVLSCTRHVHNDTCYSCGKKASVHTTSGNSNCYYYDENGNRVYYPTRLSNAVSAINTLVTGLGDEVTVKYVTFASVTNVVTNLNNVTANGGTYLSTGVAKGITTFTGGSAKTQGLTKVLVVVADGDSNDGYNPKDLSTFKNNGGIVYAVGFNNNDPNLAGFTGNGGTYMHATNTDELQLAMDKIENSLTAMLEDPMGASVGFDVNSIQAVQTSGGVVSSSGNTIYWHPSADGTDTVRNATIEYSYTVKLNDSADLSGGVHEVPLNDPTNFLYGIKQNNGTATEMKSAAFPIPIAEYAISSVQVKWQAGGRDIQTPTDVESIICDYASTEYIPSFKETDYQTITPVIPVPNSNDYYRYTGTVVTQDGKQVTGVEKVDATTPSAYVVVHQYELIKADELVVAGTKVLEGRNFKAGDSFTFTLTANTSDAPMPTKNTVTITPTSGRSASFEFGKIAFKQAGTYTYTIREQQGNLDQVIYDTTPHTLVVTVTKSGNKMVVSYTMDGAANGHLTITNKLDSGALQVTKTAVNSTVEDHQTKEFGFLVYVKDSSDVPLNGAYTVQYGSAAAQTITFTNGYGAVKLKAGESAVITDLPHGATYSITEDAVGGFTATATGAAGTIVADQQQRASFANEYHSSGPYQFTAVKRLEGAELKQDDFSFRVLDEEGTIVAQGKNNKDGSVFLDTLVFDENDVGEKTYYIEEVPASIPGYVYDTTRHTVKLTIADNGDGTLSITDDLNGSPIVFNNAYSDKTDLVVEKIWQDNDDLFGLRPDSVTVTLYRDNSPVSGQTVTLNGKNNWTHTFISLPVFKGNGSSYIYEIREASVANYTSASSVSGNKTTITNTLDTGSLTITKTVTGVETDKAFQITVSGENDYSTDVSLKNGESTTLTLPVGSYTVTENIDNIQVDGYDLTVSGSGETVSVVAGENAETVITNTYTRKTGNLTIAKTSENAAVPEGATFTITGPEEYSKTVTYSDFTDGRYTLTDLPTGDYTVTEDQATAQVDGYDLTVTGSGESKAVAENATASFAIHNEYTRETGNLTIAKTATGASVPEGATFTITGPEEYSKTVTYSDFTDGSYTLTDLPTGNYTVTEDQATAQVDGYDLTVSGSGESKAVAENATASFTIHNEYTRETGSLTIAKVIPSATSSMANDAFSFIISGPADWTGSVSYAIGQQNGTAHVQDGKITIDGIKHNDVLTLSSIPSGIYTATEAESEGNTYTYTPSYTVNGADAEMAAVNVLQNNIAAVTITNTPKMGGLKIRKTVTDYSYLIKNNDQFSFQISGRLPETVSCSINGGGATVLAPADGLLTVSGIKHGDTVILSGLPEGDFVITESMADTNLYTYVSSIPAQGSTVSVMDGNQSELAVINEPEKQTLSFSKQWEGTPPVALDDFIEHYLLLYQKYGQEEWAYSSGYAPNETGASAADTWQFTYSYLPKGYTFIMSENPVTGYKPTVQDSAYDASVTINGTKYPAVSAGGTLYNAKTRGSLQLTKQVIDTSFANGAKSFIFYITPEEGIVDECGGENWNAEMGCYEVTIVVSEPVKNYTLTLDELPKGSYTITEKPTEGYSISPAEGVTVTITDTDTATATFVNTALTGDLTIVKSAGIDVALNEQMQADSFTFEVDVPSVYAEGASFAALHNGASADAVVKNGKLTFTGVHFGDSISIQDLPIGSYTIREIYAENNAYTYTNNLTAQNTVQVEAGNSADFTVVNTPEVTTAQISKTWVGDNAAVRPSAEEFAAALTLVGVPADGESVVITSAPSVESSGNIDVYSWSNLSSRYTYYVVEDVPEGYLLTSQAAKAVLLDGKTVNLYSALTNELTKGELEVTKILVNPVITTDDGDVSFAFIVKSTDSDTHKWMQNEAAYSAADDGLRLEIPVSAASLTQSVSIRLLPGSYTVEEIEIPDGYTVSPAVPVSVTVTADSKTSAAFTNTYTASGEIQFTGTKTLNGMDLTADQFSFVLSGEGVNETVKNAADGTFAFSAITYDETDIGKTYTYTVKEEKGTIPGVTYDSTEHTITVSITDSGNGQLNVTPTYSSGNGLSFVNTYDAAGSLRLKASKTVNGLLPREDQVYEFLLKGDGVQMTARNDQGSIVFDALHYELSDAGKSFTYTVEEKTPSTGYLTTDDSVYTVVVSVINNGDGTLVASPTIMLNGTQVDEIVFRNRLNTPLTISKTVEGGVTVETFEMTVRFYDVNGEEATGTFSYHGDVNGSVTSGESIALAHGQKVEIEGLLPGMGYMVEEKANARYTTKVNGLDGRMLQGSLVEGENRVDFVNTMAKAPSIPPTGDKTPLALLTTLLGLSAVALLALARRKKA